MGACIDPPSIVMELMEGGSLYQYLHKDKHTLEYIHIKQIATDVARGLSFLHSCKPSIMHRVILVLSLSLSLSVSVAYNLL